MRRYCWEIIAVASTLEKAEEIAVGYVCEVFEIEDTRPVADFDEWLSTGGDPQLFVT